MSKGIEDYKIWFPYEIFYIESMLIAARSAMGAQSELQEVIKELENGRPNTQESIDYVIDLVQNFLVDAAALSRYFWPVRDKGIHGLRGERLRVAFEMTDDSPLKDRGLRNYLEHFDEKLDTFLSTPVAGTFISSAIGGKMENGQNVRYFIRAFHTNTWTFEILGNKVQVIPLMKEVIRIFLLLEKFRKEGGRLPRVEC